MATPTLQSEANSLDRICLNGWKLPTGLYSVFWPAPKTNVCAENNPRQAAARWHDVKVGVIRTHGIKKSWAIGATRRHSGRSRKRTKPRWNTDFSGSVTLLIAVESGSSCWMASSPLMGQQVKNYKALEPGRTPALLPFTETADKNACKRQRLPSAGQFACFVRDGKSLKVAPSPGLWPKKPELTSARYKEPVKSGRIIKTRRWKAVCRTLEKLVAPTASRLRVMYRRREIAKYQPKCGRQLRKDYPTTKFSARNFYSTYGDLMDQMCWSAKSRLIKISENKISFATDQIKVCASALRSNPNVNSIPYGNKMIYHSDANISGCSDRRWSRGSGYSFCRPKDPQPD